MPLYYKSAAVRRAEAERQRVLDLADSGSATPVPAFPLAGSPAPSSPSRYATPMSGIQSSGVEIDNPGEAEGDSSDKESGAVSSSFPFYKFRY